MIKTNGKLLQIPKLFELRNLHAFEKEKILNLEIIINSSRNTNTVDFSCLWNLKRDFYEIEIPLTNDNSITNGIMSNIMNLNISACLKFENEYLFAYSTHEVVK